MWSLSPLPVPTRVFCLGSAGAGDPQTFKWEGGGGHLAVLWWHAGGSGGGPGHGAPRHRGFLQSRIRLHQLWAENGKLKMFVSPQTAAELILTGCSPPGGLWAHRSREQFRDRIPLRPPRVPNPITQNQEGEEERSDPGLPEGGECPRAEETRGERGQSGTIFKPVWKTDRKNLKTELWLHETKI